MQFALALLEPLPPPPAPTVSVDPQARRTAQEVLVRILAQSAGTAKPEERPHE